MLAQGQEEEEAGMVAAVVCLQAQRFTGLPLCLHQIHLRCHLPATHPQHDDDDHALGGASASVSGGAADFHNQVLLLHCGDLTSVTLTVSLCGLLSSGDSQLGHQHQQRLQLHLAAERPGVLSYALTGAAAGALLTLALHRKLIPLPPPTNALSIITNCCLPMPTCCRPRHKNQHRQKQGLQCSPYDSGDESSTGFIVIQKQRMGPPSDGLPTTTNDDQDTMKLDQEELDRVEDEFLAMLDLADTISLDIDLDLDKLVRDAEAELASARNTHQRDLNVASASASM